MSQRRPAVVCALLIAIGIGLSGVVPSQALLWLAVAAGLLILAFLFFHKPRLASFFLLGSMLLVALSAAQIDRYQFPPHPISDFTTDGERFARLELSLDQPPRLLEPPPAELRALPPKQSTIAVVRQIATRSGWQPASRRVMLEVEQPNLRLGLGQIIRVTAILYRPAPPMNPGEFDWAAWCRDQRILAMVHVGHADGIEIVQDHGPGPIGWLREKARHLLAMGFPAARSFDHALLRAFVLGDPDPQLRDLDDKFARTGAIHLLSISGLHVAIIGGVTLLICRLLRRSPRVSVLTALAVVLLYGTLAVPSWPGWRSIILCAAASAGLLGRRSIDALQMFAVAVAVVLLIHPADLHDVGFQISFAAVLGMILFSWRATEGFWAWWRGPDPLPSGFVQHGTVLTITLWIWRFVVATFIAGCIAWGMSMPLIAYHFGQLSLWAVPAGVALLPLTTLALVAGVFKILLTLCWPSGAVGWAAAGAAPITWIGLAIDRLDKIPGAAMSVSPPSLCLLFAYYGLVALAMIPIRRRLLRWPARLTLAAACLGLFFLPTGASLPTPSNARSPLRITLLSLGAGQCAVIQPVSTRADLFDVGSSTISDLMRTLLTPYLRDQHCLNIDEILLSHGDFDHISAAADVFRTYNRPAIFMSPHFERHAVGNVPAEALLETLQAAGCPPHIIHQGDHLELGNGVGVDVLWPPINCDMNSNNCGLVLKVHFAGRSVLFPADIQEPPERELLKNPLLLRSDVLVAPHHGSAESTTGDFIRAVHPSIILASNYFKLTHKQKVFDILAGGYPLYRTSNCGAITVTIQPDGQISVSTFLEVGPQMRPRPTVASLAVQ
jgi:competence protein ComEC